jgi:hypothetical protein
MTAETEREPENGEQEEALSHDALIYELSVALMRLDGNDGDPHQLLWCGGAVLEPWGDAWQRYEEQAETVLNAIGEGSARALVELRAASPAPTAAPEAPTARTPKDYAIEHAEYMAVAAERLIECVEREGDARGAWESAEDDGEKDLRLQTMEAAVQDTAEALRTARSGIYEFRKRKDRALRAAAGGEAVAWLMTTPEQGNRVVILDAAEAKRFAAMDGRTVTPLYTHPKAGDATNAADGGDASHKDLSDTINAIFSAVGYTEEYARQWPKEKASVTFKRWFDEQLAAARTVGVPGTHETKENDRG